MDSKRDTRHVEVLDIGDAPLNRSVGQLDGTVQLEVPELNGLPMQSQIWDSL
jgi:hypothetical protein